MIPPPPDTTEIWTYTLYSPFLPIMKKFFGGSSKDDQKGDKHESDEGKIPEDKRSSTRKLSTSSKTNAAEEFTEEEQKIQEKIIRKMDRKERRRPLAHPTEFPIEIGAESAAYVHYALSHLDKHYNLLVGMSFAYAIAYLGWTHWSWMVIVMLFVILREFRKYRKDSHKLRRRIELRHQDALITTRAEGSLWLNDFLHRMLPMIKKTLTDTSMQSIKQNIENYMTNSKPPGLDTIEVTEIEFGEATPRLLETVTFNLATDFQTEFDLSYESNFKMSLVIKLGSKLMSVPFPIQIKNIKLIGRMRLTITFCDKMPFLEVVTIAFKSPPQIDMDIKPLGGIDIMDINSLKLMLTQTIQNVLIGLLVLPERLVVQLQGEKREMKKETPTALGGSTHSEPSKLSLAGTVHTLGKMTNFITNTKDKAALAKCNGTIHLKIHKGVNLPAADSNGLSDPYLVATIGELKVKTKNKKKTLDPVWEEELHVKAALFEGATLDFEIFDWNQFDNHTSLGVAQLDLTPYLTRDNVNHPHEITLPLTLRDMMAKDNIDRGTIYLAVVIQPDPFADIPMKSKEVNAPTLEVTGADGEEGPGDPRALGNNKSRSFRERLGLKKQKD
ncbi:hypothetical protein PROFUN_01318 [Planoprotostelium fungivorum]|uniref:C2 domain-containing protein n=1 Tax=Planoprotostelium fungivorum TaxID=1890364 RepID=A0A2P6NZQ4_9EUKA|nr:hypothetical protein PROFUN_01318 [Planoprotostelium fungivorum]